MKYIHHYKDHDEYRASFNRLARLVFGIDFEGWYNNGCWDDQYVCHSFLNDNEVVANISISKMDLVINGVSRKAIQIGTVMTHPEYRGRGLSKRLMEHVLEKYEQEYDLLLLFANQSVLDFYPKFGFAVLPESQFTQELDIHPALEVSLRKLDCTKKDDMDFIRQKVQTRRPISQRFGVVKGQGIFTYYAMNVFPACVYYSEEDDAIIVFECEGETLHLYDVVPQGEIDLHRLLSRMANEQTRSVRFYFTPEQLTGQANVEPFHKNEDVLFVKPVALVGEMLPFCAPKLAHA